MNTTDLDNAIAGLPSALRDDVLRTYHRIADEQPDNLMRLLAEAPAEIIARVWACSPFVAHFCTHSAALNDLLNHGLESSRTAEDWASLTNEALAAPDENAHSRALRVLRNRELVRIAWRDIARSASLDATMWDLSCLADQCIQCALTWTTNRLIAQFGTPCDAQGNPQGMLVIGMGKLGAHELNFSSDIDLIFAYPQEGHTNGGTRSLSNEEFFLRVGQNLIKTLQTVDADGFAYRVDMRLRPFGDSGPLVASFDAMEFYYTTHARDWERYAMVKARVVAGCTEDAERFMKMIRPFVYRRYLDYGAFESIREMKRMIAREVMRKDMDDNIKLGGGGIREIEFIGQTFQLLRGGRQTQLQDRRILAVLDRLAKLGHLDVIATQHLADAYKFLRETEHRLQEMRDEQTHSLPRAIVDQSRLALALGFHSYEDFLTALALHRQHVRNQFSALMHEGQSEPTGADSGSQVWPGLDNEEQLISWLKTAGFDNPAEIQQQLTRFRQNGSLRRLSRKGQERFDRLLPLLMKAVAKTATPALVLERVTPILEAIGQRSVYLALLAENSSALEHLLLLSAASPWISAYIARHPILLDELIDPRTLFGSTDDVTLKQRLNLALDQCNSNDLESEMEVLRQFKHAQVLRVAAADVSGRLEIRKVSDNLTAIAECVVTAALQLAWRDLARRHGTPSNDTQGELAHGFAIIAYGKLGGYELGYGSDLDLVFLCDGKYEGQLTSGEKPVEAFVFFTRLAQRIIHILSTITPAGQAYEVDIRLRPNGASGLLVTSMEAFAVYQTERAWTWEHQALIRARAIAGDSAMQAEFARMRESVLCRARDRPQLRKDVLEMRQRLAQELGHDGPGRFDLKHGIGGITDIEFMVQYCVLLHAGDEQRLLAETSNRELLLLFAKFGLMPESHCRTLLAAYLAMRNRIHELALQQQPAVVADTEFVPERQQVRAIWQTLFDI